MELKPEKPMRWWPLALIVALAVLALGFIWSADALHRQKQVMQTMMVLPGALALACLWLLLLSRLQWRVRLRLFAAIVLIAGLSAALFRIGEVSGDLVPIPEWRWVERVGNSPANSAPPFPASADGEKELLPDEYPQFLGPDRNATLRGIRLARDWSKHPPRLVWRQPVGAGWSAFAVVGNSAITQEQHGDREMVVCRDLQSGQVQWSHGDTARYESTLGGIGPRATPTVVRDRVYTLGGTGRLNCLDLATGERIWQRNILEDNKATMNPWGTSCSPLVLDTLVVVSAGGLQDRSLVAYHKDTGAFIWGGGSDPSGYSSPFLTTLADVNQILIFNRGSVAAHDPLSGRVLWRHPWPDDTECVAQPVPLPGDQVFVSSGYGIGCKLLQVRRHERSELHVSLVWETPRLKAKFTNVVYRDGYIYGLDDGVLVCLDAASGQRQWKRGRYGHGQVLLVGDVLLVQTEGGDIVLVEASPQAHTELAHLDALDGKTWNNPALAAPYLLVRNGREAACYELALEEQDGRTAHAIKNR